MRRWAQNLIRLIRAAGFVLLCCAPALAAAAEAGNVCATAALQNPDARFAAGSGGMGGTGSVAGTGGMGGTGSVAGAGGMGGTGAVADVVPGSGGMGGTGIVGVITGFASICVNGLEVHYDNRTPVSVNGQPGAPRDLAVGQVVAVNARDVGGRLQASGIGVVDAVSGPITRINPATRELQVMGQTVRVDNAAGADLSTLRVGTIARISGHRTENGDVIATRVDTAASGTASLHGTVTRVESDAVVINGTRVTLGARGTRGITPGSELFAAGEWSGNTLQARRIDTQPVRNAISRSERAVVEGYVSSKSTREMNVGNVTVRIDERVRYSGGNDRDADVGRKVQVEVRRSGNEWQAERVFLQRDDRAAGRGGEGARSGDGSRSGSQDGGRSDSDRSGSDRSGSGRSDSGRSDSSGSRSDRSGRESGSSSGSSRGGRN